MNSSERKELLELINYHIENKIIMTVERKFNDAIDRIMGFPLIVSEKFLFMTIISDFHDEGYTLLRINDIFSVSSEENDAFYEKICIAEGLKDKSVPDFVGNISNIGQFLDQINKYDGYISIQCEKQVEKNTFYLGNILKINENCLIFEGIEPDGRWDEELNTILFEDITQISFDDHYSKTFYKYVTHET